MTLAPLIAAGPVVQAHALMALTAVALGALQLALPKGGPRHRWLGRAWVGLLALVCLSSFGIGALRQFGPFSWIHGLSAFTLPMLAVAIAHARAGRIDAHRWTMIGLFAGALVITGLFTLMPGRLMHAVLFGT
ncbi:DUF2306 domain-containing protein [Methylobacterium trifolii]|uniref:DUF2306 domain-containing protein n=1 Tax=Methylobacterium trifolii TaxID=1003092 RepID=A0ABQ4U425_9HYPH|nr:DUF2306 domain-containing protein [Methylobacterium trifolii]GJE62006.1 hypothetical protein MPOCJGCO_4134 [Methylobacterium trifolii]